MVDCIDVALLLCTIIVVIASAVLEKILQGNLESVTIADILITLVSLLGMVYEATIADDLYSFFSAETLAAEMLRSCKCWRLFTLIVRNKECFSNNYSLLCKMYSTILKIKYILLIWAMAILMLALMNFHLQQGKMLLNSQGQVDLDNGNPNQFCFSDVYHSLISTLLNAYDEEWDILMFQEYRGVNKIAIPCMLITMFLGYIICTKYLVASLTRELDVDLMEEEEDGEDDRVSASSSVFESTDHGNGIVPFSTTEVRVEGQTCIRVKNFLKPLIESKVVLGLKILFILLTCFGLVYLTPNVDPT